MSAAEKLMRPDPTEGLELVTGDEIALEATRHIFLAGDLLDPARRRDINLPEGGEELANRCLRRTNGLLPRCLITPMEFWGEPLPMEFFPEGVRPYRLKQAPATVVEQQGGGVITGMAVSGPSGNIARRGDMELYMVPIFPGEQIVNAIGLPTGERRGIVEIEVLRGVDYGSVDREMQNLFFPPDWPLPIQLRLVEERIQQVADSVADPDVKSIAANMLLSATMFREYAMERIGLENTQILQRVKHNHVYRYSPKIRSFAAQLEIQLQAGPGEQVMNATEKALAQVPMEQLAQINAANTEALGKVIADAITQAIAAAVAVSKTPEKPGGE